MVVDLKERNFPENIREEMSRNRELVATLQEVFTNNLLSEEQAIRLASALMEIPGFHVIYSHGFLGDLKQAGILNEKNINTFFSLLPHSAFLSSLCLILSVKGVMTPSEQAQKNFDLLCEYVNRTPAEYRTHLINIFNLITNIDMSSANFQRIFENLMDIAREQELIDQLANRLITLFKSNFKKHLSQKHTDLEIERIMASVFTPQSVTGSPRKLRDYSTWRRTALTLDDFQAATASCINEYIREKKTDFLICALRETPVKKFLDSKLCDRRHLVKSIFRFLTPEIKIEKKQPAPVTEQTPPSSSPKSFSST